MQKMLTDAALEKMPEGTYWDTQITGLHMRVGKNRKTWQLRYSQNGKKQFERLGYYPTLKLKAARLKAEEMLERLEQGLPVIIAPPTPPKDTETMEEMVDKYERFRRNDPTKRNKTLTEAMRAVRFGLRETGYLQHRARLFTKTDLRTIRDKLGRDSGIYASNRFLAYLNPVIKWAVEEDIMENEIRLANKAGGELPRERVLSDDEIRAIWKACGKMQTATGISYGRLVRFLLLTAQRREEVAIIRRGDVTDGYWCFDKNKSNREQCLQLPSLAIKQLGDGEDADQFVFMSSRSGQKIAGWSKLKTALDTLSGVTDWTLHDLRRTASTRMQKDTLPPIIDAVLNHAIPGVGGRHYLHYDYLPQKAEALRLWQIQLEGILGLKPHLQVVA